VDHDVSRTEPRRLADLMAATDGRAHNWQPSDLSDMLRHQLGSPLLYDAGRVRPPDGGTDPGAPAGIGVGVGVDNLAQLLSHPRPPIDLLLLAKEFAKSSDGRPSAPLPAEIATVLYYAAIAAALARLGQRITALGDDALRRGLRWAAERPWLVHPLPAVLQDGLAALAVLEHPSPHPTGH